MFALFAAGGVALSLTSESWAAEEEPKSYSGREILAAEVLSYIMFGESAMPVPRKLVCETSFYCTFRASSFGGGDHTIGFTETPKNRSGRALMSTGASIGLVARVVELVRGLSSS